MPAGKRAGAKLAVSAAWASCPAARTSAAASGAVDAHVVTRPCMSPGLRPSEYSPAACRRRAWLVVRPHLATAMSSVAVAWSSRCRRSPASRAKRYPVEHPGPGGRGRRWPGRREAVAMEAAWAVSIDCQRGVQSGWQPCPVRGAAPSPFETASAAKRAEGAAASVQPRRGAAALKVAEVARCRGAKCPRPARSCAAAQGCAAAKYSPRSSQCRGPRPVVRLGRRSGTRCGWRRRPSVAAPRRPAGRRRPGR